MRSKENIPQYWTVAESCAQLEEIAGNLMAESVSRRESIKRCQELDAVKRRAAFKLITPKNIQQGLPAIPIGFEEAFFEALEQHQKEMSEIYPA